MQANRTTEVHRDPADKRLGAIRELSGLENHHQLLSAPDYLKNAVTSLPEIRIAIRLPARHPR